MMDSTFKNINVLVTMDKTDCLLMTDHHVQLTALKGFSKQVAAPLTPKIGFAFSPR
jgi:hypothetical protein